MLISELFRNGIMVMGPSHQDPSRVVGVFGPGIVTAAAEYRAKEMESFRWIEGEWDYENEVPATPYNPTYVDAGSSRFVLGEGGSWVCAVSRDGKETPNITFDPLSKQWVYLLFRGAYGLLRSPTGWSGDSIAFSGPMLMLGIDCEWKLTLTREGPDRFAFVNEERGVDGGWKYVDKWRFRRRHS